MLVYTRIIEWRCHLIWTPPSLFIFVNGREHTPTASTNGRVSSADVSLICCTRSDLTCPLHERDACYGLLRTILEGSFSSPLQVSPPRDSGMLSGSPKT